MGIEAHNTVRLFDLEFSNLNLQEALQALIYQAESGTNTKVVVTPNTNHLVYLERDKQFKELYRTADFIFADGFPLVSFSRWIQNPLKERVTGADLMPLLMRAFKGHVAVIGGRPGQEKSIESILKMQFPHLDIAIISPSDPFNPDGEEARELVHAINLLNPQIVFVCLGMPKQELWALKMKKHLTPKLIVCFGAALDFILKNHTRAPKWMQQANLEWLWRLMQEPHRLGKRYLVENLAFIKIALEEYKKRT